MHMGPEEEGCRTDAQHKDLEGLGLVHDNGALDQSELARHQCLPALQTCRHTPHLLLQSSLHLQSKGKADEHAG